MPRGTIDWKSPDSYTRLLAAIVASNDLKLNYKKIADMYGEGATYDAIEGRFRIIRKEAEKLKTEIDNGLRAPAPPRGTSKPSTPRKPRTLKSNQVIDLDGVQDGRVAKSANGSPNKRRANDRYKKEMLEASTSTSSSGEASNSTGSEAVDHVDLDDFNFDPSFVENFPLPQMAHNNDYGMGMNMSVSTMMDDGSGYFNAEDEEAV